MLAACGSRRVTDEAPFVQVTSWRIDGTLLSADVRIRNINEEPLPVTNLQMKVMLETTELFDYDGAHTTEVSANGFEILPLQIQASQAGTALLAELQSGRRTSLPYELSGRLRLGTGQVFPFEREGHIYTVPGKPGEFR